MLFKVLNAVLYFLSGLSPRNRRKVVFGAWLGTKFSDNPKYLLLHLAEQRPDLELIWIGQDKVRPTLPADLPARFVRRGSWSALYETLTASYCFITHHTTDVSRFNLLRKATVVYLGHGLALKHMGTPDVPLSSRVLQFARSLIRKAEWYAFMVSCCEEHSNKLLREYSINGAKQSSILATGQPRVDFLIANKEGTAAAQIRHRLLSMHGLPSAQRIITYMPTFRDKRQRTFSFLSLDAHDRDRLHGLLEKFNAVILEKSHFADAQREGESGPAGSGRVFGLRGGAIVDTQELLLSTDLLITDYSGCYLDFLLLDRPVIHFAYDRDYYTNSDRGLYFDLDVAAGGPVIERFDALCESIEQELLLPGHHQAQRKRVRTKLMTFESGDACRKISIAVFENKSAAQTADDQHPCQC